MPDEPRVEPDLSFLARFLHPNQFIEFRLKAEGADGLAERFYTNDLSEVARRITDPTLHAWFGVANRRSSESGDESNLGYAHFLYVDLDHVDAEEALHRVVVEAEFPKPTLMVNSGHGIHAYWKLDPPLDLSRKENLEAFRRAEEAISAAVEGDERARDAARVLRVPGTWNPKDPPAACVMVKRGEESYPLATFDPEERQDKLIWVWRHTKVHYLALGIAGWCYHKGISQEDAETLISEVASAANDPELGDRLRCVRDAYEGGAQGKEIAYKPHLDSRMGKLVLQALEEIWGKRPEGGPLIPVVDGKQYVQPTTEGVDFLYRKVLKDAEVWTRAHVIPVPLRFTHAYDVEGTFAVQTAYPDRLGEMVDITNFDVLPRMLRSRGLVMRNRLLDDTLGALRHYHINNGIQISETHPAPGVYYEGGRLELVVEEAIPLTTPQEMMKDAILENPSGMAKEDLEAYLEVLDYFEPWEVLPVMGLAAIAPFLFELKQERLANMIPTIFIVGPHGLGKTTLNAIFTSNFYRTLKVTGKSVDSQFRLDDYLNATTFPIHVEEGEDINFDVHAPKLKAAAESHFLSSKGKPSREQDIYLARGTLFLDGNEWPIQDWNLMVRFILIEMEEGIREDREAKAAAFDVLLRRLRPVGLVFAQHLVRWMNESAEAGGTTAMAILDNTIQKARDRLRDLHYPDVRRSTLWAIIYTGLLLWEKVCKDHGLAFQVDMDVLRQDVITPLETAIREGRPILLGERFRQWWIWRVSENVRTRWVGEGVEISKVVGEGGYFVQDKEAWYIAQDALQTFEGGRHKLSRIATALAEAYGEKPSFYYHRNLMRTMDDDRRVRVLRLPKAVGAEGGLEDFSEKGKQSTFTDQIEQIQRVREYMEGNGGRWVSPEAVAAATGVEKARVYLSQLASEGVVEPLEGRFRLVGAVEEPSAEDELPEAVQRAREILRSHPGRPASFVTQDLMEAFGISREEAEAIVGPLLEEGS